MSEHNLMEEIILLGADKSKLGILTLPHQNELESTQPLVFVLLNAGLLHRVGPKRLYVRLARILAEVGIYTFRVDLTGRGDSVEKAELRNTQTLTADFQQIVSALESRLGSVKLVLGGLCSGADNAMILTQNEPRVLGMLLIDSTSYPESGIRALSEFKKYFDIPRVLAYLKRKVWGKKQSPIQYDEYDKLTIGVLPTPEEIHNAYQAICVRKGKALSVFTSGHQHYNKLGQLARILRLPDYDQHCVEKYFSAASHTFDLEAHRRLLLAEIKSWSSGFMN